ncbi:DUF397 domain-containing protein [Nocardiopsis suaedae]|uniref:DUF397 domain-containing protein n=1 Tax=Nocardiopsis suaedae TaxID=3018444 RepID=A0ABT4TRA1_9ACTN|nr:DUF397 domain-containing protein [Nocardiopsis suaedae]MDA2807220.1 DUF397 domain-containing protein [Nocardiopsis suaedae]
MSAEPTPSVEGGGGRTAHRPSPVRPGLYDGQGWRTSTRTDQAQTCVEAAPGGSGAARVRDSHHPALALSFGPGEWAAFLALEARSGPGRRRPAADALTTG